MAYITYQFHLGYITGTQEHLGVLFVKEVSDPKILTCGVWWDSTFTENCNPGLFTWEELDLNKPAPTRLAPRSSSLDEHCFRFRSETSERLGAKGESLHVGKKTRPVTNTTICT